jgi:uncharacterized protein (TIGR02246 family)
MRIGQSHRHRPGTETAGGGYFIPIVLCHYFSSGTVLHSHYCSERLAGRQIREDTDAMNIQHYGTQPRLSDADDVRALYVRAMDGWNRGSGEAFAAPFANESDFVAFDGTRFRGREEIARFHNPLFKTHLKGTRLVGEVTDVRLVSSDVAVLHAYGGTVPRGKTTPAPERDSIQTLVAVKPPPPLVCAHQRSRCGSDVSRVPTTLPARPLSSTVTTSKAYR